MPALFPPYKEDPERLRATLNAIMGERTEQGQEMWGAHRCCTDWIASTWETPQMATSMVAAAFQRYEWSERIDPDKVHDGYPLPTEEEERQEDLERSRILQSREALLYSILGSDARSVIEMSGIEAYLRKQAPGLYERTHRPEDNDTPELPAGPPAKGLIVPQ